MSQAHFESVLDLGLETKTGLNENAIGLRFSGRAWTSGAWTSDDDRTEKICAIDQG